MGNISWEDIYFVIVIIKMLKLTTGLAALFSPRHVEMMVIPVTNRQQNGLRKQVSSQPINHGNAVGIILDSGIILFIFA